MPTWLTTSPANQSQTYQLLKIKTLNGSARHQRTAISASLCSFLRRIKRIPFFKKMCFFLTLKENCEKWYRLNWWGSTSNLKLPFLKSKYWNNHLYYQIKHRNYVKGALLKFGNKNGKAEFSSHQKITEYNIYTPLPYDFIKWSLFLRICI